MPRTTSSRWRQSHQTASNLPNIAGNTSNQLNQTVVELTRTKMPLVAFPRWIQIANSIEFESFQKPLLEACLERMLNIEKPLQSRKPFPEQTRTLFRLIFGVGDTILIARTGFGKSLIFQAYTILTALITIQIVPLSKLADEQLARIKRLPGTNPCFINPDSKAENPQLFTDIIAGRYTHILLSPEQAVSEAFQKVLKTPEFVRRVGLVAIDEVHLVKRWELFRPEFAELKLLRVLLPQSVTWFGCTATLDDEIEKIIQQHCGFRPSGALSRQTAVIRTSINRENIALVLQPIPYGKMNKFEQLYFLLDNAVDSQDRATPEKIPKTIIFLSTKLEVARVEQIFQRWLMTKTTPDSERRYTRDRHNKQYCASRVIEQFHSDIAEDDKTTLITEYAKPDSSIRIIICTSILSVGYDIPDIKHVVIWRLGKLEELHFDYLWQRIGRAARIPEIKAIAFIFLEYWAFNDQGVNPNETSNERAISPASIVNTQQSQSNVNTQQRRRRKKGEKRQWSGEDIDRRKRIPDAWVTMINGICHRKPILQALGEDSLHPELRIPSRPTWCCSTCSPNDLPTEFTPAPPSIVVLKAPAANSGGAFAMPLLDTWARSENEQLNNSPYRRMPLPTAGGMDNCYRWEIADQFNSTGAFKRMDWETFTWIDACTACKSLPAWIVEYPEYAQDGLKERLVDTIKQAATVVQSKLQAHKANAKRKRDETNANRQRRSVTSQALERLSEQPYFGVRQVIERAEAADQTLFRSAIHRSRQGRVSFMPTIDEVSSSQVSTLVNSLFQEGSRTLYLSSTQSQSQLQTVTVYEDST